MIEINKRIYLSKKEEPPRDAMAHFSFQDAPSEEVCDLVFLVWQWVRIGLEAVFLEVAGFRLENYNSVTAKPFTIRRF